MQNQTTRATGAVFYDVDGALTESNIVYIYLYYSLRLPRLKEKFRKVILAALYSPVYAAAEKMKRGLFVSAFYKNYRGIPEERLRIMGREIVQQALLDNLFPGMKARIEKAKAMGMTQVIISHSLDVVMEPFAVALGVDHAICNRLEFEKGHATGKLINPVISGAKKIQAVTDFAARHNISLVDSYIFGSWDLKLLELAGYPCPVNPEKTLWQKSEERGWPILRAGKES